MSGHGGCTAELVTAFLRAKEAKGLSRRTIAHYRYWLGKFSAGCPEIPHDPEPIESFVCAWQGITRRNVFRAIRALYTWLVRTRKLPIQDNPFVYMDSPRTPKKLPRIFTSGEVLRLLDSAQPGHERALVLVLLDGAPRIGEMVGRTKDDLTADGLRVNGKRGERLIPLLPTTIAYLRDQPTFYLFPVLRGKDRWCETDAPASVQTLQRRFRQVVDRAGVTGPRRGPHTMRHTSATSWLRSSGDISALKQVLGHASIRETEVYVALLTASSLSREHRQHSALLQMAEHHRQLSLMAD